MFMKKIFKYFFAVLCCASVMTVKAANEISIAGLTISDEIAASGIVDALNQVDGDSNRNNYIQQCNQNNDP